MSERKLRVAVIIGSVRSGRFGPAPADWIAAEAAKRDDLDVDVIDLARAWLPDVLPATAGTPAPQAVQDLAPWLDASDAFVIVTPEYNHSFPASLGRPSDPEGPLAAATSMLDQLTWWGRLLRDARAEGAYPG
ncbi:NADPH-dependent FMN reductase [Streptomyces arboris]|uniref:NADPH-dependent FMN reductase-like domain-containing protein n=1 Tax=Streptomyces arboris TaxID=2600619 RepID=A0A5N5EJ41_9ACTN|nr:NAD(P)H-dependent oxidoreductase [Streptomyces arboris]KAB2590687.1 hypothetical protein F5983_20550 [Streptomyces arboris]